MANEMMKKNKYSVVIFDWDGTLVDSTARIVDSMQLASSVVGLPMLTNHAIQQIIGLGLPEALRKLWPEISEDQLQLMRSSYSANFSRHSNVEADFFPQAHQFFEELQRLGYVLAVATGKTRKGLDEMLDSLNVRDVFDITRCADETTSKPDPHMLEEILAELQLSSDQALMVGDTSFDLDMAKNINMDAVGMTHGAHESSILLASGAKALCHDLNELLDWIKKNG
jgi:phosphoglycolate phosphatase